ncbi:hypothetical protein SAMN06264849_1102 [Melghirimyces algeriensis]|uniref:Uncharacterized protein n=1 Tax=Melghirimyces algeriensis TaxID=910412 RepID=A0A521EN16_9BACL|nr:hypothetical protein SAMN06264849_1102 [Melghirimyces algeriensis]
MLNNYLRIGDQVDEFEIGFLEQPVHHPMLLDHAQ